LWETPTSRTSSGGTSSRRVRAHAPCPQHVQRRFSSLRCCCCCQEVRAGAFKFQFETDLNLPVHSPRRLAWCTHTLVHKPTDFHLVCWHTWAMSVVGCRIRIERPRSPGFPARRRIRVQAGLWVRVLDRSACRGARPLRGADWARVSEAILNRISVRTF
jgi:hypothetical protein